MKRCWTKAKSYRWFPQSKIFVSVASRAISPACCTSGPFKTMLNGVAAEELLVGQRPGQTQNHTKSRGFHSPQGGMTKQMLKVKHANNIQKVILVQSFQVIPISLSVMLRGAFLFLDMISPEKHGKNTAGMSLITTFDATQDATVHTRPPQIFVHTTCPLRKTQEGHGSMQEPHK